jgi:hypothetical protein
MEKSTSIENLLALKKYFKNRRNVYEIFACIEKLFALKNHLYWKIICIENLLSLKKLFL